MGGTKKTLGTYFKRSIGPWFLLMAVNYQCMPLSIAKGIAVTVTTKLQKIALSDSKSARANPACEILL